ncbi:SagB-type dehydrogenase domain-containing protein [Pseudomonas cedrina]|uniref:Microcin B17 processing protein McbC n=2 Tax=Pseudomonas cedrina TaxID=651740 RepID=A0A1V2KEL0_PSECE|nr:SagB/ThcOx family dehydrogenase [Pseudomonas cedrina]MDQ0653566.1 SagB-type dehydrogenase family enzyme [Pseudomonas cedrina]ONH56039.1 microcin B17 processing protein McbC [Pseudomonas cedrina subsp. cedrina]SDT02976.1 SagB-type dehydrogenase domain-containing protein [Pseudomonas cedrina]
MKNIPHDYYFRFIDPSVYEDVLDFHCKGNFTFHNAIKDRTCLHRLDEKHLAQLTGNELTFYPDMNLTVEMTLSQEDREKSSYRNESCKHFSPLPLNFSDVEKLMWPLLSRSSDSYKRGYPSGGALYPAEIFLCSLTEENSNWPCVGKILHLLPGSRKFEVMQIGTDIEELKAALLPLSHDIGMPSLALIYAVYMPKNLFKYRYRGYRMALMEVGSIYMLVELQAKSLGLACRLWSAYTDSMLCKALGINPALFFPMCVHFIGKQHETY